MPQKQTIAQKNKKKQPKIPITLNLDEETIRIIDLYSEEENLYNRSQAVRQIVQRIKHRYTTPEGQRISGRALARQSNSPNFGEALDDASRAMRRATGE